MGPDREPTPSPGTVPSELEAWAEHRAALDATLFSVEVVELELRDGTLVRR